MGKRIVVVRTPASNYIPVETELSIGFCIDYEEGRSHAFDLGVGNLSRPHERGHVRDMLEALYHKACRSEPGLVPKKRPATKKRSRR